MTAHRTRRLICRVVGIEDATYDVRIVRLAVVAGGPLRFRAGQYASLTFDGLPPRDYSMANRPEADLLEFHIRETRVGSTSGFVASRLSLGDEVKVEGPYGEMWLRRNHGGSTLAIAGGSGLAPIKSIVETALAAGMKENIHLYFGARVERDLYLVDHFERLARTHPNLSFVPVLSRPKGPTERRTGPLPDVLAEDFADLSGCKAYLAGPPGLVAAAVRTLKRRGIRPKDIHAEPFYSDAEKKALGLP